MDFVIDFPSLNVNCYKGAWTVIPKMRSLCAVQARL